MNKLVHIPLDKVPRPFSEAVAHLYQEPPAFQSIEALKFSLGEDEMGEYQAAAALLENGETFSLQRYNDSPLGGVAVHLEADAPAPLRSIGEILRALSLSKSDLCWLDPELIEPG